MVVIEGVTLAVSISGADIARAARKLPRPPEYLWKRSSVAAINETGTTRSEIADPQRPRCGDTCSICMCIVRGTTYRRLALFHREVLHRGPPPSVKRREKKIGTWACVPSVHSSRVNAKNNDTLPSSATRVRSSQFERNSLSLSFNSRIDNWIC